MQQLKSKSLSPIFESSEGLHLTVYIENTGDLSDIRGQLSAALESAREHLEPILNDEGQKRFLAPLLHLSKDTRLLRSFSGNIGVFRTMDSFRVLNVPVEVERMSIVATSFHVKPLLRWLQDDREFLFIGLQPGSATIYHGTHSSIERIDQLALPPDTGQREPTLAIQDWLGQMTPQREPRLFIAGEPKLTAQLSTHLKYPNLEKHSLRNSFSKESAAEISAEIMNRLLRRNRTLLNEALMEFTWAEETHLAKKNIFQIAKAAVRGRIDKLIIADKINIFGKLNRQTGGLSIHPADIDHEDDDLLDDIAQTVLKNGGQVIIAPAEAIPKSRPILAILKPKNEDKNKYAETSPTLTDSEVL